MSGRYRINPLEPKTWDEGGSQEDTDAPQAFRQSTKLSQHISFLKDFFRCYKDFSDRHIDTIEIMNITHVGIYAGDGKVVDASSSKGQVVYRDLFDSGKQVLYARPYAEAPEGSASGLISPLGKSWRSMTISSNTAWAGCF